MKVLGRRRKHSSLSHSLTLSMPLCLSVSLSLSFSVTLSHLLACLSVAWLARDVVSVCKYAGSRSLGLFFEYIYHQQLELSDSQFVLRSKFSNRASVLIIITVFPNVLTNLFSLLSLYHSFFFYIFLTMSSDTPVDVAIATAPNDIKAVPKLLGDITAGVDALASGGDEARHDLLVKARTLVQALETPRETMVKHCWAQVSSAVSIVACSLSCSRPQVL